MESVFYGIETLKINIMTSERIKEIQQETAYPNSVSVQQALLTVWNECEQERVKNCSIPAVIRIPIELHFAGDYRLEYDGKYIALFGRDKNYEGFRFSDEEPVWYEEMVLIGCVLEVRNANPIIKEVTDTEIVVDLGCI